MLDPALLRLLQLSDSALPVGGFSHSWGLETWVQQDQLTRAADLRSVLAVLLEHSVAPLDGLACALAHNGEEFVALNQVLSAAKWASEPRQASLDLGRRLILLAQRLGWVSELPPGEQWHHCTAFGWLCRRLEIALEPAVGAYLLTSLTGLTSAAVRLVPLGHSEGQQVLTALHPQILSAAQWCCTVAQTPEPWSSLGGFTPHHELACQQHRHLYSRLFQS